MRGREDESHDDGVRLAVMLRGVADEAAHMIPRPQSIGRQLVISVLVDTGHIHSRRLLVHKSLTAPGS